MSLWLNFWTLTMLLSGSLFLVITLVVAVGGLRDLRQMLHGFSQKPIHTEEPREENGEENDGQP